MAYSLTDVAYSSIPVKKKKGYLHTVDGVSQLFAPLPSR